jgi:hypothetical protein
MEKSEYTQRLLKGRIYNGMFMQGALVFWHSGVPLYEAEKYMDNLDRKLNGSPDSGSDD